MPLHMTGMVSRRDLASPGEEPVKITVPPLERVLKFNPHHDPQTGRFIEAPGGRKGGTMGAPTEDAFGRPLRRGGATSARGTRHRSIEAAAAAALSEPNLSGFRTRGNYTDKHSGTHSPHPGQTTMEFRPGVSPEPKAVTLPYVKGSSPHPGATTLEFRKEKPYKTGEMGAPKAKTPGRFKHIFRKVVDTFTGSLKSTLKPTRRSSYS